MAGPSVTIIDSGGANINSVVFAFQRLGVDPAFTDDWEQIRTSSHVVLPGVGSAASAMEKLNQSGLASRIPSLSQPVIGICLGMQLLFESSEEGDAECLGVVPARVRRFKVVDDLTIPHMGWNKNSFGETRPAMFGGLEDGFHGYFVHSFAAPIGPWTVSRCRHGEWFSSMIAYKNFYGIQFHPERSGEAGSRLLERFLRLEREPA